MNEITQEQFLRLVGNMVQGIASNPASGSLVQDSYGRQMLVTNVIQDVGQGLANSGIQVKPNE